MGAVADGRSAAGGEVIGVIPQELVERELAHGGLTALHVVGSLHERKALMAELADAFAALPGGFGTLDELLEQLTWSQLGLHREAGRAARRRGLLAAADRACASRERRGLRPRGRPGLDRGRGRRGRAARPAGAADARAASPAEVVPPRRAVAVDGPTRCLTPVVPRSGVSERQAVAASAEAPANASSKTSASACAAAGRTSSTASGRPSSRAIDVNA